jgi:hypothetical protein
MEVYQLSGKYEFRTGQVNDKGFPMHCLQPEIRQTVEAVFR